MLPMMRVPSVDESATKSALDAGADGILFPLIRTAQSAAECVALTRYPPEGRRGFGPFVGHSRWGVDLFDYLPKRGGETVCAILIETRSAIEHLEEICKVEGIDCMTIAPFDLSTELGVSGQLDAPELVEAVTRREGDPRRRDPAGWRGADAGPDPGDVEPGLPAALAPDRRTHPQAVRPADRRLAGGLSSWRGQGSRSLRVMARVWSRSFDLAAVETTAAYLAQCIAGQYAVVDGVANHAV
jgi:HpcH/HpaI aldolase/citrate lyase family